jgi:tetratricopeptide (TPR) repeat protein
MMELLLQAERTLAMGRLDDAEQLYRKALDADPRNAIAVVGLARLSIERGDDHEAYRLAGRALELDPENAAAIRLAVRLHEVLRTRGESVELPPRLQTGKDGKVTAAGRRIVDRLLGRDGRAKR